MLSLGAGVQSSTLLRMALHGELELPDDVIFADTKWEPFEVYMHLTDLEHEMRQAGVNFHRVSSGDIKYDSLRATVGSTESGHYANMPYFILYPDGGHSILRRQCTKDYKIDPITQKIRELYGIPHRRFDSIPKVEHWFGISYDEQQRMSMSRYWWAINHYPLVDLKMTRGDCQTWLKDHGYGVAPRSACVACPYRSNEEWRHLKQTSPEEFEEACAFDEAIRKRTGLRGDLYIHRSRTPLRGVDFTEYQPSLFDDECAGMCGM